MRFLDEFQTSLKQGLSGIILSGSTRDYFPLDDSPENFEKLFPLSTILAEKYSKEYFPVIYSQANGFTSANCHSQKLAAVLGLQNSEGNPVDKASNQMVNLGSYEAPDAINLIKKSCFGKEKFLIILDEAETYCAKEDGTGNSNLKLIPNILTSLVCSPAFIEKGHVLVLITNSAISLSDRLICIDSPIKVQSISRPLDDEREAYLKSRIINADDVCESPEAINLKKQIKENEEKISSCNERIKTELDPEIGRLKARFSTNLGESLFLEKEYEKEKEIFTTFDFMKLKKGSSIKFFNSSDTILGDYTIHSFVDLQSGIRAMNLIQHDGRLLEISDAVGIAYATKQNKLVHCIYKRKEKNVSSTDWHECFKFARFEINGDDDLLSKGAVVETNLREVKSELDRIKSEMKVDDDEVKLLEDKKKQILDDVEIYTQEGAKLTNKLGAEDSKLNKLIRINCTLSHLVKLTKGLSYMNLQQVLRAVRIQEETLSESSLLEMRKDIYISSFGHLLEIIDPEFGFEGIAGLNVIKDLFMKVANRMRNCEYNLVPMGNMLMGPPGTGKSAIAEALAREAGLPFVKMKQIRNSFVGASERNLEEALNALRALAPVVVFKDEIDEEDSGRDSYQGDSGVSARMRQQWMTFLSDPKIRGKVFVVSCTNRPDRIDPALLRSGRMDERIPVLMPDEETRIALFDVMLKRSKFETNVDNFLPFAEISNGLSGADIEVIVRRAYDFAIDNSGGVIDAKSILFAIDDFIPSSREVDIAKMTLLALDNTSSRRYLPTDVDKVRRKYEKVLNPNYSPKNRGQLASSN